MIHFGVFFRHRGDFGRNARWFLDFRLFFQVWAIIAVAAVFFRVFFARMVGRHLSTTCKEFNVHDDLRRGLLTGFLLYCEFSLRGLLRLLRIFVNVRDGALPFSPVSSNASNLLMVSFRAFECVMVGSVTRVQFIGPRAGDGNDCGRVGFFRRRVVLILYSYDQVRSNVVNANVSSIYLRSFDGLLRFLPTRTVSGT